MSRKYFTRCNQLNKHFPEGWVALGNSYAAQDESDQALSAYRTCLRLFPGCHYANLYLGMEYIRSNNLKTAFTAFTEALTISSKDPLVYNEVGVVFYKQKHYLEAETHFNIGKDLCKEDRSLVYQNIVINLAHTSRKLK
jgi:anaphase-promoting complex subunit 6